MQDISLYLSWRNQFSSDRKIAVTEIQDWLTSGWRRIAYPAFFTSSFSDSLPFDPFGPYVHDEDSALDLMLSLREISLHRSAEEAIMVRQAVSAAICAWNFNDTNLIAAIRLSFRAGSIFGCTEVCDVLAGKASDLVAGPQSVITGLSDMAANLRPQGRNLVERLVAASCDLNRFDCLPYLLTCLIELSSQSDVNEQRDLILRSLERYGGKLKECFKSIDALEALTDTVVSGLRLIEGILNSDQVKRLVAVSICLDSDILQSIPQIREAFMEASHQAEFLADAISEVGAVEVDLLLSEVDYE